MVDYKVFFVAWTSAVVAQCVSTKDLEVVNHNPPVELWAFLAGSAVVAGMFHNWFWRLVVFGVAWTMNETRVVVSSSSSAVLLPSTYPCAVCLWMMLHTAPTWYIPRIFRPLQQIEGAVFVTGADSGMGFWTVLHLAKQGYRPVFAGCYTTSARANLEAEFAKACPHLTFDECIQCISLDVTNDASVQQARTTVEEALLQKNNTTTTTDSSSSSNTNQYLTAVINCAGLGYNGPAEYFPLELYQKQMDVNFYGYVRVVQAFLPLLKQPENENENDTTHKKSNNNKQRRRRRGRIVLIGTGGGVLSPAAPLLAACKYKHKHSTGVHTRTNDFSLSLVSECALLLHFFLFSFLLILSHIQTWPPNGPAKPLPPPCA